MTSLTGPWIKRWTWRSRGDEGRWTLISSEWCSQSWWPCCPDVDLSMWKWRPCYHHRLVAAVCVHRDESWEKCPQLFQVYAYFFYMYINILIYCSMIIFPHCILCKDKYISLLPYFKENLLHSTNCFLWNSTSYVTVLWPYKTKQSVAWK